MDRLIEAIERMRNPSVIGLDPTPQLVPSQLIASYADEVAAMVEEPEEIAALQLATAYFAFNRAIIDAVSDIVPAVKPQIAMYEALGPAGVDAYAMTCEYAQECGLYVIGDIKRGDIGSTASAYAHHLTGVPALPGHDSGSDTGHGCAEGPDDPWHEDAITVNPYFGADGVMPFVEAARHSGKDIFVLVHTSNPSSAQLQELELKDGGMVHERVARLVESWGSSTRGSYGYSAVGGVYGATFAAKAPSVRASLPHTMLLVPGYGAQGGTAADVADLFDTDGRGAIVSSSRGIIGAWRHADRYDDSSSADESLSLVADSARLAAVDMRDALRSAVYR